MDYLSSQPSCFLLVMALTGLSCHTLLIIVIRPVALEVGTSRESMIDVSNVLSGALCKNNYMVHLVRDVL